MLYEMYSAETTQNGRRVISQSIIYHGLEAGNFKEVRELAGLRNICSEWGRGGAENFQNLSALVERMELHWDANNTCKKKHLMI